jgi:uncharacterized protein YdaT
MNERTIEKSDKIYIVKRIRLLNFLISKGFKNYEIIPDPTSTKRYNWFIFEDSEEIRAASNEYYEQRKNNNLNQIQ